MVLDPLKLHDFCVLELPYFTRPVSVRPSHSCTMCQRARDDSCKSVSVMNTSMGTICVKGKSSYSCAYVYGYPSHCGNVMTLILVLMVRKSDDSFKPVIESPLTIRSKSHATFIYMQLVFL